MLNSKGPLDDHMPVKGAGSTRHLQTQGMCQLQEGNLLGAIFLPSPRIGGEFAVSSKRRTLGTSLEIVKSP